MTIRRKLLKNRQSYGVSEEHRTYTTALRPRGLNITIITIITTTITVAQHTHSPGKRLWRAETLRVQSHMPLTHNQTHPHTYTHDTQGRKRKKKKKKKKKKKRRRRRMKRRKISLFNLTIITTIIIMEREEGNGSESTITASAMASKADSRDHNKNDITSVKDNTLLKKKRKKKRQTGRQIPT
ncbi:uncharacterized [Tachysurus ichikawai]